MGPDASEIGFERAQALASRHVHAWLLLVVALALHVADEALTDFLGFYNPLMLSIRARVAWWPMPTFAFGPWLTGLMALVAILAALAPAIRRGAPGTRLACWLLSSIMCLNGLGHLVGSLYFLRWLPGATTAPLLLVASAVLAHRTRVRPAR